MVPAFASVRFVPRPTRGEWIEMSIICCGSRPAMPRPTRGEWIEIPQLSSRRAYLSPRPTRGEWIEIIMAKLSTVW